MEKDELKDVWQAFSTLSDSQVLVKEGLNHSHYINDKIIHAKKHLYRILENQRISHPQEYIDVITDTSPCDID